MNLKLLIYTILALFGIAALGGFIAFRGINVDKPVSVDRAVYVEKIGSGFQLIRNGKPFVIRGAGGDSYFKELAEIGGNTVRLFDSTDLQEKLDEAHRHGLAVIVDIYIPPYNTSYNMYKSEVENVLLKKRVRELVVEHKDHPALLMWNLGNELKYPLVFKKNDFIITFNELVSIIQEVDPNHPVSTSIIGAGRKTMSSIYFHSPELDIVSFNTFGNTMFVNKHVAQVAFLFGAKPYLISELGPNGPWESNTTSWGAPIEATNSLKSDHYRTRRKIVEGDGGTANLGSLFFYWGEKLERTHTWFSLFRNGRKSTSVRVIEALWKQSDTSLQFESLNHMLLNGKGAQEDIVLSTGKESHAEVFFHGNSTDHVSIEWEIYPEAWYSDTNRIVVDNYRSIDTFVAFEQNRATFLVPSIEGPYRIFVYIYNQDGSFTTTNIPFYVLESM